MPVNAQTIGDFGTTVSPIITSLLNNANFNTGRGQTNDAASATMSNLGKQQGIEDQLLALAQAPITDATGNTSGFDPSTGSFTTKLSNTGQTIESGANQNTINMLDQLAPLWNQGFEANAAARDQETKAGQGFLGQMTGPTPYTAAGMTGQFQNSALQGVKNAYRNVTDPVVMQMMRSGGDMSNLGNMLEPLAQQESGDYSKALSDAAIQGPQAAESLNTNWANRLGNMFTSTADRGANIGQSPASGISNLDQSMMNTILNRGSGINQAGSAGGFDANAAAGAAGNAAAGAAKSNLTPDTSLSDLGGLGSSLLKTGMSLFGSGAGGAAASVIP